MHYAYKNNSQAGGRLSSTLRDSEVAAVEWVSKLFIRVAIYVYKIYAQGPKQFSRIVFCSRTVSRLHRVIWYELKFGRADCGLSRTGNFRVEKSATQG